MSFGTARAQPGVFTTIQVWGFAGKDEAGKRIDENWTLRGNAALEVTKDFVMTDFDEVATLPIVTQMDHSLVEVRGTTIGGEWRVLDDSEFRGEEAFGPGARIEGGVWAIEDRGMVFAGGVEFAVDGTQQLGDWSVQSQGDPQVQNSVGLEVENYVIPDNMVVDGGAVKRTDGDANFVSQAQIVRCDAENCGETSATDETPVILTHQGDGVTVTYSALTAGASVEAIGVDYHGNWSSSTPVYFTDSPCVVRWGEIKATKASGSPSLCLFNGYVNMPISGPARDFPEATYVKVLTIGTGVSFSDGGNHLSYIGSCTIGGVACDSGDDPILAKETQYGDFDGDADWDATDITFFNSSWCARVCEAAYEPLVDHNSDGRVAGSDRTVLVDNYTDANGSAPTGLSGPSCSLTDCA